MSERLIIVIPENEQTTANLFCSEIADGGENTFVAGLSADGKKPITHYWCNWNASKAEAMLLKQEFVGKYYAASEWTPDEVLDELGLKRLEMEFEPEGEPVE